MVLSNGLEPVNHKIIVHPAIFLSADYYTFGKKFFQNILPLKYDIRGEFLSIHGNAEHDHASLSFSSIGAHAHTHTLLKNQTTQGFDWRFLFATGRSHASCALRLHSFEKLIACPHTFRKSLAHRCLLPNGKPFPLHESPNPPK